MAYRARGEGTIARRKNGTYEGKLSAKDRDGAPLRKSFYGHSRAEVAEKMREYRARNVGLDARFRAALGDFLMSWLDSLDVRPNTFKLRRHFIQKHIVPHIGARPLCDVTSDDVRFLLRRWRDDCVGAVTQRSAFITLSSALNVAVREEKINRNPCNTVSTPKARRPEIAVLDGAQALRLVNTTRDCREHALLALAVSTGVREGEIFALWWENLDLEAGTLTVEKTLTEDLDGHLIRSEPKTSKSRRIIYLPTIAHDALLALRRESSGTGFVFTSRDGGPLRKSNFIRRVFKPLLKSAGLPPVTFHSLRHTANSLLIEAGEDPLAIAGSLGHSDTRMMFERYGHLFNHTAQRVAQTANRIFDGLDPNCRTIVVNAADRFTKPRAQKTRKALRHTDFPVVEMRGLEPPTPYMRSKCSTS